MSWIVDEVIVSWMRNGNLDERPGRADAINLLENAEVNFRFPSKMLEDVIEDNGFDTVVLPWPWQFFQVVAEVWISESVYVHVAGHAVVAATEIQFYSWHGVSI
jgi:hypothetical protein